MTDKPYKKVVSFSLWGNNKLYTLGAVHNSILVPKYFGKDWTARFYIESGFRDFDIIDKLIQNDAEIIYKDYDENHPILGMTWRFLPACDPEVEIMLSRDTDSRITQREVDAVQIWLNSDCNFHVIRDNPGHLTSILGGTWGCRGGIPDLDKQIEFWKNSYGFKQKGDDQIFLDRMVWPIYHSNCMAHDQYFTCYNQKVTCYMNPLKVSKGYVGCVIDAEVVEPEVAE